MARTQARTLTEATAPATAATAPALPYTALARDLRAGERLAIHDHVHNLLRWQRTLARWPAAPQAPDATPFVSIYADGILRGCFGSSEGAPGGRLTRAFLRALEDSRYGSVRAIERGQLAATVSYLRRVRSIDADRGDAIEVGREGVLIFKASSSTAILLPQVACDAHSDGPGLLALLRRKAGLADWSGASVFAFTTEDVVVRSDDSTRTPPPADRGVTRPRVSRSTSVDRATAVALARGAAWLARLVADDGRIAFALDARKRHIIPTGTMHHGRAAVALRALAAVAARVPLAPRAAGSALARTEYRARAWLEGAVASADRGAPPLGWPAEPAMAAGTLALALLAGVGDRALLIERAASPTVSAALCAAPWHGAQVAAALGLDAPASVWQACVADLAVRPWAPWTVIAARARGDGAVACAAAPALWRSIRPSPPHQGGCSVAAVPETAVTALVVEALAGLPEADAKRAVLAGRRFIARSQLLRGAISAALDPQLGDGAFPASPVVTDYLRCDMTGHALLALLSAET